ncbi:uncharacterized protein DUF4249 [Arcticibacter tournemirensis]|uniref:DUF4249 domain-containing protein n=2 Tax=Arcticibacter tournemirensis TaxID=699437 RepID=A0A5M9HLR6_9SPHI|nr:DUF4249 domain-containing protein [Arcticibacter tournemirensis]TQM52160.1 uncharacterized protein DUF4249 [Arcticibacter tournemirensis]
MIMKILKLILILLAPVLLFSACEDPIDIDVKEGKPALVVEGWLTDRPENHYVKLYITKPLGGSNDFEPVRNATLTLSDDAGHTEQLKEVSAGKYEISAIRGVEARTYTLRIQTAEGSYEAVSKMPRLSMAPDSLTFKYEEKSIIYEQEGYYPYIHGQELPGEDDFIQVKLFKNNRYLNSVDDINIFPDKFVDGNYIDMGLEIDSAFAAGDTIRAEVWSLTENAYYFWADLQTQLRNGGIFASPLTNTRTNVKKLTENSKDVIGYFGISLVGTVEKKIE